MSDELRLRELGAYLLPVLCGNTKRAHRLSAKILRRLGTMSLICGDPHLRDLFDPSSLLLRLPKHPSERLLVEALMTLPDSYPDRLPVLVPCSKEAERFVREHAAVLETRYLLRDEESLFFHPPLSE